MKVVNFLYLLEYYTFLRGSCISESLAISITSHKISLLDCNYRYKTSISYIFSMWDFRYLTLHMGYL